MVAAKILTPQIAALENMKTSQSSKVEQQAHGDGQQALEEEILESK